MSLQEVMLLAGVFVLNLPFGYWRASAERFSLRWFLAVHLPVPLVFLGRIMLNVPVTHIPFFVLFYFLGQFTGARLRRE